MRGVVVLVGTDGAGKSTVIDAMQRRLGDTLVRAHSRPGVIAGRPADGAPVTDPHAARPRGAFASLAKLAVVFLDTVIGSRTRWRRIARTRLLVVERGWYDLAVDPRRYRLPTSFAPLVGVLGRAVPRADLTVLLAGSPQALHERKPEIGVEEVARQQAAWQTLARRVGRRLLSVDTVTHDPEACATAILEAVQRPAPGWRHVPAAPRRLAMRATGPGPALAIYRPHRGRARAATVVNGPLLRAGLAPTATPPAVPHMPELLDRCARPATQVAALRSSHPGRWVVGVADRTGLHTVIKIGATDDAGLVRELTALEQLASSATVTLPQLAWHDERDGWRAVATSAVRSDGPAPSIDELADTTTTLTRGELGAPVVHGDLAPWNLARVAGQVAVWDWEEAELGTPRPLHDLTHYLVRAGTLVGAVGPEEAARLLTAPDGPGARHLEGVGVPADAAADLVAGYLARTSPSDAVEAAFRDALAAFLRAGR